MIHWDGVRPAVQVSVNGRGPYVFLIDTGAGGMARADTSLVQALGLSPSGTAQRNDGSAADEAKPTMPEFVLESVSLGNLARNAVPAPSRSYSKKRPIDGILGYGFFAGCLLTLDFARKEVRVRAGQLKRGPGTIKYGGDEGGPEVPIHIGRLTATANLDTGDNLGFTLPQSIYSKLTFSGAPRVVGTSSSANTVSEAREAPLVGKIAIGAIDWQDPVVSLSDLFENINIGSAALQDMVITFDQENRIVRMTRPRVRK